MRGKRLKHEAIARQITRMSGKTVKYIEHYLEFSIIYFTDKTRATISSGGGWIRVGKIVLDYPY